MERQRLQAAHDQAKAEWRAASEQVVAVGEQSAKREEELLRGFEAKQQALVAEHERKMAEHLNERTKSVTVIETEHASKLEGLQRTHSQVIWDHEKTARQQQQQLEALKQQLEASKTRNQELERHLQETGQAVAGQQKAEQVSQA